MLVTVEPHNPCWIRIFEEAAAELRALLGANVVAVYHIGSTAIPTAWAKPIIDLLVVVRDLSELDRSNESMVATGYEAMGEYGISGRRYFRKSDAAGVRFLHVHAYEKVQKSIATSSSATTCLPTRTMHASIRN